LIVCPEIPAIASSELLQEIQEITPTVSFITPDRYSSGASYLSEFRETKAMGSVVNLHTDRGPWALYERAVLGAIQREFSAQGIETDCEHGRAEDGTPWTAFYTIGSGQFVVHVARKGRNYILIWVDHTSVQVCDMDQLVCIVRRQLYPYALRGAFGTRHRVASPPL
jgi:hypothetical protein